MKFRLGFVSNSSSTSFVMIGSMLEDGDVFGKAEELIAKGRLYARAGYEYTGDGEDFFPVSKKMWEAYEKYNANSNIDFFDVEHLIEENESIKKSDIDKDEFSMFWMEVSQHSCETLEDFVSRHMEIPLEDKLPEKTAKKVKQMRKLKQELQDEGVDVDEI